MFGLPKLNNLIISINTTFINKQLLQVFNMYIYNSMLKPYSKTVNPRYRYMVIVVTTHKQIDRLFNLIDICYNRLATL